MGSRLAAQIRVTGQRAGIRVFSAFDVPVTLKSDTQSSEYLTQRSRALAHFSRKHPGATVLEARLVKYKENDRPW